MNDDGSVRSAALRQEPGADRAHLRAATADAGRAAVSSGHAAAISGGRASSARSQDAARSASTGPARSRRGHRALSLRAPTTPGLAVDAAGRGTFAVVAPRARAVDLCIHRDGREIRLPLARSGGLWWTEVSGMVPGTRYGLRADGPWDPSRGRFFNPARLLLDPRGEGVTHRPRLSPALFAHRTDQDLLPIGRDGGDGALVRADDDNASETAWSVVPEPVGARASTGERPRTPWRDTVLYELHVKGFTSLADDVPAPLRGTYAGLAHPAAIARLVDLGITAVELLPIQASLDEPHLARLGLTNYWGYSTLASFAPEPSYATAEAQRRGAGAVADEVRGMVRALHDAGIEVISDVVYNHTAEGDGAGPTLSLRGLDAHEHYWYAHDPATGREHPVDMTGTGATLDPRSATVVDLILGSLRHWAVDYGIDGFRFDLAATLGRGDDGFRADHPLLRAIAHDPVLGDRKLIAEPWDIGPDGWQTGSFGAPWAEWNDAFRDDVREFWLAAPARRAHGDHGSGPGVGRLATRLAGSSDILTRTNPPGLSEGVNLRAPWASIDFLTAHDGFTLRDLTVYDRKHNLANGEGGADGANDNRSWNHGAEGADGAEALALEPARRRTARAMLATLLLAAGTPMLTAGDERARTQRGNNNAYCQDNEISWISWEDSPAADDLTAVTRRLIELREAYPQLRPASLPRGFDPSSPQPDAVGWFSADGHQMRGEDWNDPAGTLLQMLRPGDPASPKDSAASRDLVVVVSGGEQDRTISLPRFEGAGASARTLFSSADERPLAAPVEIADVHGVRVPARSVLLIELDRA